VLRNLNKNVKMINDFKMVSKKRLRLLKISVKMINDFKMVSDKRLRLFGIAHVDVFADGKDVA